MTADYEINCLDSMHKAIERYQIVYPGRLFFRGEAEQYPRIALPGILRKDGYLEHEADFYNDLKNMHQSELLKERDYIDKLALMQHYGAPTRLIDMTVNPYIALYFACENHSCQEHAGYVYMYVQNPVKRTDRSIRLLSWMACNKWHSFDEVCKNYRIQYSEPIDTNEAVKEIERPLFIRENDFENSTNERIKAQRGTFAICGEKLSSDGNEIVTIDTIPVVLTLRIPAEYKQQIISELETYGINTGSVYLDFSSASNYLRDKYSKTTKTIDEEDYEKPIITDRGNTSYRRSKDMRIIMKNARSIEYIHEVVKHEINKIAVDVDVVWTYVAMTYKDYVRDNYRTRMLWINPSWKYKDKFPPSQFKIIGDDGYSWEDSVGTSIISDLNDKYLFADSEEYIYVSAFSLFERAQKIYANLKDTWSTGGLEALKEICNNFDEELKWINEKWDNLGVPDNKETGEYLNSFSDLFINLQTLSMLLNGDNRDSLVELQFNNMQNSIEKINSGKEHWRSKINATDEELSKIVPLSKVKKKRKFIQTIPISEGAIDVKFHASANLDENGLLDVICDTNLYDDAELLISVKLDNKIIGNAKTKTDGGKAIFRSIGKMGEMYLGQSVYIKVTMAVSAVQSIDFVKKAGIQYENLKGDFIDRTAIAPAGKYEEILKIQ